MRDLSESLRYEEAGRLRDRIASLERVVEHLARLEQLRRLELCLVVPALGDDAREAIFVAAGRIVSRRVLPAAATRGSRSTRASPRPSPQQPEARATSPTTSTGCS